MSQVRSVLLSIGLIAAFAVLATLNTANYRYGVSDQAFYIPAILASGDPALFPRDRQLFSPQGGLTLFDEAVAALSSTTGVPLPWIFFAGFLLTLVLLAIGYTQLGRHFYRSPWTIAAFCLAMTLRHRVPRTSANTLEGYFHPRVLAFAIGLLALSSVLRGQPLLAVSAVAIAGLIHPTTALWFAICLGGALMVSDGRSRRVALVGGAIASAIAVWAVTAGPLRGVLMPMDAEWLRAFETKDYVFPTEWPLSAWMLNFANPVIITAAYLLRRRAGLSHPREGALVAGTLALLVVFLVSLPLIAAHVALAVQLQVSRVFWLLDAIAMLYLIWLFAEGPAWRTTPPRVSSSRAAIVALVIAAGATARGVYVGFFEHPDRALVQINLPLDDWSDAMEWLRSTPADTHVLADPGHAWRHGTSVRVAAARDVYLEEVKDAAMSIYSRDVARRVVQRSRDLGSPDAWTEASLLALASRADLTLLVTDRVFELPVAYENARFRVYRLRPSPHRDQSSAP